MADLVKYRERFMVPAATSVEVRVTFVPPEESEAGAGLIAWYMCLTCSDQLEWQEDQKFWACLSCGYEMTATEASQLCDHVTQQIEKLQSKTKKKRGFLWRLSRLFVGKTRPTSA